MITLVRYGSGCPPPTVVRYADSEGHAYPIEFNTASWTGNEWMVHLGEALSLPELQMLTQSRLVQCAHSFSDAVVFLAEDLLSAGSIYLKWLACCLPSESVRHLRPAALIIIGGSAYNIEDFLRYCATQQDAGVRTSNELRTDLFDNIKIEQVENLARSINLLPPRITQHVAWEHIRDSHKISRRLRSNHGCLWTLSDFRQLALAWKAKGSMPKVVLLLTNPWPPGKFSLSSVLSSADGNVRSSGQRFETVLHARASLVSSYLMRHSFRSRHWTVPGESSQTNMFAEDQFRLRYLPLATSIARSLFEQFEKSTSAAISERYVPDDLVSMIKDCWLENTRRAYRSCVSVFDSAQIHIKQLRQHRGYLAGLQYGTRCAACLLEQWAHMLPCRHGLCTLCLRACHGKEASGCRMNVYECPVCEHTLAFPCLRTYVPSTATVRVLALDGGGVKGLVQLQILEHLLGKIGLRGAVHISSFFDLVVGSSIGGIYALGLGTKKWSLEDCRVKFLKFAEQLFIRKSRCARLLSYLTGGWSDVLNNAAKLIFFDSIYDSAPIERILMESFDDTSLMIQDDLEHPTRVAVVVNQASTSETTIFTNYNKSRHRRTGAYRWPPMDSSYRLLRIWEVARATSAAPGFWKSMILLGEVYQDGGLSHNNPSAIAASEANLLAPSQYNDPLVVSVGCGRFSTAPLTRMSVFRRYIKVFEESLSAARQHEVTKMQRHGKPENLLRLNPRLGMDEVLLNEQSSMSSLSNSVQAILGSKSSSARLFTAECETVVKQLIASLFYFELGYKLRKGQKRDRVLQLGTIKTRLTEQEFEVFREMYPEARFRVKDLVVELSAATEIEILQPISGSPFTVAVMMIVAVDLSRFKSMKRLLFTSKSMGFDMRSKAEFVRGAVTYIR